MENHIMEDMESDFSGLNENPWPHLRRHGSVESITAMGGLAMVLGLVVISLVVVPGWGDVNVMKDITLGFGEALKYCRNETQLTEETMEEVFHFWRKDFSFENREVGCVIQCMSNHFNLLTDSQRMHHENTDQFFKSFPNGELLSKEVVGMIHTCEKQFDSMEDHCWRILRIAECFKAACQQRGLAPTVEVLMAEFLMESEAR